MKSTSKQKSILYYFRKKWFRLPFSYVASFLMVFGGISPQEILAIGGGPTSPEYQAPTAVGGGGMVNHFSGDVQYSIPLFEVGGYPVALNYTGNISPEQDAGWVGLGWSLNLGAITRGLRGLPDDFKGDEIQVTANRKPHIVYDVYPKLGDSKALEAELLGLKVAIGASNFHVIHDNYRGIGLGYSINTSLGIANHQLDTFLSNINSDKAFQDSLSHWRALKKINQKKWQDSVTSMSRFNNYMRYRDSLFKYGQNLDYFKDKLIDDTSNYAYASLGFTTDYNSFSGNSYVFAPQLGVITNRRNPYLSESQKSKFPFDLQASASMRLNSEVGIQSAGLNTGFMHPTSGAGTTLGFGTGYNQQSFMPSFDYNVINKSVVGAFHKEVKVGTDVERFGGKVQYTLTKLASSSQNKKGYGYFYQNSAPEGNNNLLDYEQENKILDKHTKSMPATVQTYDVFNISGVGIGGSFRGHYNSVGIVGPTQSTNTNSNNGTSLDGIKAEIELSTGNGLKMGGDLGVVVNHQKQEPWKAHGNEIDELTSFQGSQINQSFQGLTLRNMFEFIETDNNYNEQLGNTEAGKYQISRLNRKVLPSTEVSSLLINTHNEKINELNSQIKRSNRSAGQQTVAYLTAEEAGKQSMRKRDS